jgi:hypothetical protein
MQLVELCLLERLELRRDMEDESHQEQRRCRSGREIERAVLPELAPQRPPILLYR